MIRSPESTAFKLRRLAAQRLQPAVYLKKLVDLADIDRDAGSFAAGTPMADVDRVVELRNRIAVLEKRIRQLEGRK